MRCVCHDGLFTCAGLYRALTQCLLGLIPVPPGPWLRINGYLVLSYLLQSQCSRWNHFNPAAAAHLHWPPKRSHIQHNRRVFLILDLELPQTDVSPRNNAIDLSHVLGMWNVIRLYTDSCAHSVKPFGNTAKQEKRTANRGSQSISLKRWKRVWHRHIRASRHSAFLICPVLQGSSDFQKRRRNRVQLSCTVCNCAY